MIRSLSPVRKQVFPLIYRHVSSILGLGFQFRSILFSISSVFFAISENFISLPSLISPWLLIQIERFFIPRIDLWVFFLNLPFSLISHLNSLFNLAKFQNVSWKYLNSLWIRPLFTIIPFNSLLIPQFGKLGFIFDTRPCEIDDLAVSSRQSAAKACLDDYETMILNNMYWGCGWVTMKIEGLKYYEPWIVEKLIVCLPPTFL